MQTAQEDGTTTAASSDERPDHDLGLLLLRADQAAALCCTSTRTWRTWNTAGRIPRPIYIGRAPLWRPEELKAWVAAGCPDRDRWDTMRE